MSYYYKRHQFLSLGIGIDEIINNQESREVVKNLWKHQMAFQRFQKEKEEKQYKKDCVWWEKYSQQTVRYFLKYGDMFPIMKYMRPFAKFIIENWLIWALIMFLIRIF